LGEIGEVVEIVEMGWRGKTYFQEKTLVAKRIFQSN
jgi:hypothetical protein